MFNTTANEPNAQDPMLVALAMRCIRLACTESAEAAREAYEQATWDYRQYDIAAELAALIAALAVD